VTATNNSLVITGMVYRGNPGSAVAWTNGVGDGAGATSSSITSWSGYALTAAAGTKESTASWTTSGDASAAVVVFKITPSY